jgi:hypothetical protein
LCVAPSLICGCLLGFKWWLCVSEGDGGVLFCTAHVNAQRLMLLHSFCWHFQVERLLAEDTFYSLNWSHSSNSGSWKMREKEIPKQWIRERLITRVTYRVGAVLKCVKINILFLTAVFWLKFYGI